MNNVHWTFFEYNSISLYKFQKKEAFKELYIVQWGSTFWYLKKDESVTKIFATIDFSDKKSLNEQCS